MSGFGIGSTVHPDVPLDIGENWVLAAQALAQVNSGAMRAINVSAVSGFPLDAASVITRGLDWSSRRHNLLYCVASGNFSAGPPVDMYNGLVVGASMLHNDGVFRRAWTGNAQGSHGDRRLISILAPGSPLVLLVYDNPPGMPFTTMASGTSGAAPHATGTAALLHQYADQQGWTTVGARRHEVMKAVLMNSADKIKDSGDGKRLCMEKDIVRKDGETGWLASDAFGAHTDHPIDDQMGVGQLNAKRAVKQFSAGQQFPGVVNLIGWDYQRGGTCARWRADFHPEFLPGGAWQRSRPVV